VNFISDPVVARKKIDEKKLLVFDFDGVIADSVEVKTDAFAELYRPYGEFVVKRVIDHHRDNGGMSRYEKFYHYHKEFLGQDIDQEKINDLSHQFSEIVVDKVVSSVGIAGAKYILEHYCGIGKICVVNSATPQDEICKIVKRRNQDNYFSKVYGSPASKVENLKKVMSHFRIPSHDMVFFGDARSDMEAAYNTNVDFIGIGEKIRNVIHEYEGDRISLLSFNGIL